MAPFSNGSTPKYRSGTVATSSSLGPNWGTGTDVVLNGLNRDMDIANCCESVKRLLANDFVVSGSVLTMYLEVDVYNIVLIKIMTSLERPQSFYNPLKFPKRFSGLENLNLA